MEFNFYPESSNSWGGIKVGLSDVLWIIGTKLWNGIENGGEVKEEWKWNEEVWLSRFKSCVTFRRI